MVVAGVAGAVVLGVTLGVWARPADPGKASAPAVAKAKPAAPLHLLQVVVGEAPVPPIGDLLEVLPAGRLSARPRDIARPEPAPAPLRAEPVVPRRPVSGLMKVDVPQADPPQALMRTLRVEPEPEPARRPRPDAELAKAKLAKARLAEAQAADARASEARAAETRMVEARAAEARIAAAKARKASALAEAREIRLEQARAAKLEKARLARLETAAKAQKAQKATAAAKLAKAEVRPSRRVDKVEKVAVKTPAKPKRLAATPVKVARAEARPVTRAKTVKVAAVRPAPQVAPKAPPKAAPKPPPARRPVPRDDGSLRMARAERTCASPDPGEAIVCADQRLGQRDRQLQEAYRSAEAAGVPASVLRRQQFRWQQARAAAAREAPWAVEDVYVARISELKGQTRDARED
jgi:hypothetical protein